MVIYNQKLAGILMQKGFVLQGMGTNKHDTTKNVFFFKDTKSIREVIKELTGK